MNKNNEIKNVTATFKHKLQLANNVNATESGIKQRNVLK